MEKVSKNTAPPEAADPNAVAGSCPERDSVQPSDNEMHPEPAAASSLCRSITPGYAAQFAELANRWHVQGNTPSPWPRYAAELGTVCMPGSIEPQQRQRWPSLIGLRP